MGVPGRSQVLVGYKLLYLDPDPCKNLPETCEFTFNCADHYTHHMNSCVSSANLPTHSSSPAHTTTTPLLDSKSDVKVIGDIILMPTRTIPSLKCVTRNYSGNKCPTKWQCHGTPPAQRTLHFSALTESDRPAYVPLLQWSPLASIPSLLLSSGLPNMTHPSTPLSIPSSLPSFFSLGSPYGRSATHSMACYSLCNPRIWHPPHCLFIIHCLPLCRNLGIVASIVLNLWMPLKKWRIATSHRWTLSTLHSLISHSRGAHSRIISTNGWTWQLLVNDLMPLLQENQKKDSGTNFPSYIPSSRVPGSKLLFSIHRFYLIFLICIYTIMDTYLIVWAHQLSLPTILHFLCLPQHNHSWLVSHCILVIFVCPESVATYPTLSFSALSFMMLKYGAGVNTSNIRSDYLIW